MTAGSSEQGPQHPGYEKSDVGARAVIYAALALFVGVGASAGFVLGLLNALTPEGAKQYTPTLTDEQRPSPSRRLQLAPASDRARIEAAAMRRLHGYQWVDRERGVAAIPIERAMQMLAERGWPDAGKAGPP
jgi:hypothetical protein